MASKKLIIFFKFFIIYIIYINKTKLFNDFINDYFQLAPLDATYVGINDYKDQLKIIMDGIIKNVIIL